MTEIPQEYLEELLLDPVMAAEVILGVKLDAFQKARLRIMWFTPDVEDSSGFSSGKTIVDWIVVQLSAVLIPGCHIVIIYQTFQAGKDNFWQYYSKITSPIFRAQLGRLDVLGEKGNKSEYKDPGCFKQWFKNGSCVSMPAPGFAKDANNLAGLRCSRILIDEWTKIMTTAGGVTGITKQLMGRATLAEFSQAHPVWCNKIWKTATAEQSDHPAFPSHAEMVKEIRTGNPDFYYMRFCYKDYSDLPSHTGRSFKDEFRNEKRIKALITANTPEKMRAEVLGIWSKMSRGWFEAHGFEMCRTIGARRKVVPIISRDDPKSFFFLGADPAASKLSSSDVGALSVIRARLMDGMVGTFESDWEVDYVWAREVRSADIEIWSGIIHQMNNDFGFSGILLDAGGGGIWIAPELRKPRQLVNGVQVRATPIVYRDAMEIEGQRILSMVDVNDSGILMLFSDLKNGRTNDRLKDGLMTILQVAIDKGLIGMPQSHFTLTPDQKLGWGQYQEVASWLISKTERQALKIRTLMDEHGGWKMTRNQARIFFSNDKDDLVDSLRNAYAAFRIWLLGCDFDVSTDSDALGDSR